MVAVPKRRWKKKRRVSWLRRVFFLSLSDLNSHFRLVCFLSKHSKPCPPSSSSAAWRRPSWASARGPCGSTPRRRPRSRWPTPVSCFSFLSQSPASRRRRLRADDAGPFAAALRSHFSPKPPAFDRGSQWLIVRGRELMREAVQSQAMGPRETIITSSSIARRPTTRRRLAPPISPSFGRFCALASPSRRQMLQALDPVVSRACPRAERLRSQGRCEAAAELGGRDSLALALLS
jgi:hypothetical protein